MLWTKQNTRQAIFYTELHRLKKTKKTIDKQSLIQNNIGSMFKQCRVYVWMDLYSYHTHSSRFSLSRTQKVSQLTWTECSSELLLNNLKKFIVLYKYDSIVAQESKVGHEPLLWQVFSLEKIHMSRNTEQLVLSIQGKQNFHMNIKMWSCRPHPSKSKHQNHSLRKVMTTANTYLIILIFIILIIVIITLIRNGCDMGCGLQEAETYHYQA